MVGSGATAKAVLYYITDYITKSQLKTQVAFAMLELAVKKLGEFNPLEDDKTTRAKKLLPKCAYTMIPNKSFQRSKLLLTFATYVITEDREGEPKQDKKVSHSS